MSHHRKALGVETRRRVALALQDQDFSQETLAEHLGVSRSTACRHLNALVAAGKAHIFQYVENEQCIAVWVYRSGPKPAGFKPERIEYQRQPVVRAASLAELQLIIQGMV